MIRIHLVCILQWRNRTRSLHPVRWSWGVCSSLAFPLASALVFLDTIFANLDCWCWLLKGSADVFLLSPFFFRVRANRNWKSNKLPSKATCYALPKLLSRNNTCWMPLKLLLFLKYFPKYSNHRKNKYIYKIKYKHHYQILSTSN